MRIAAALRGKVLLRRSMRARRLPPRGRRSAGYLLMSVTVLFSAAGTTNARAILSAWQAGRNRRNSRAGQAHISG